VLIGGSVALAVGGSTSCVRWLNDVDPMVEWCGIEVESVVRWVLLLRRSAVGWGWGRPDSEREMKTKIKEND
jgi:hypothetical protein